MQNKSLNIGCKINWARKQIAPIQEVFRFQSLGIGDECSSGTLFYLPCGERFDEINELEAFTLSKTFDSLIWDPLYSEQHPKLLGESIFLNSDKRVKCFQITNDEAKFMPCINAMAAAATVFSYIANTDTAEFDIATDYQEKLTINASLLSVTGVNLVRQNWKINQDTALGQSIIDDLFNCGLGRQNFMQSIRKDTEIEIAIPPVEVHLIHFQG